MKSLDLLYMVVCSPRNGMSLFLCNTCPGVVAGLFGAAVVSTTAFLLGSTATVGLYGATLLLVTSISLFYWIVLVAQVHFWARLFGETGDVLHLFRASSSVWVPITCGIPALFLRERGGYLIGTFVIIMCVVLACKRAWETVAVVYMVDGIKAFLILVAPMVSLMFLGSLIAVGELALMLQML